MYSKQLKNVALKTQLYGTLLKDKRLWKIHFTVFFKVIYLRTNGLIQSWT